MHESMKQMIQTFAKQRVLRRRAYAAFTALALVVSISTMYTLSKPAVTMTGTPVCGMEEHEHDEDCYILELVCGVENHNAVDETAEAEPAHEHDETCYEQQNVQICTLEEGEAHSHSDDCTGIACGEEEYEAHTHDETCYTTRDQQICGEDEYDAHSHDAGCYETHTEQTCGESAYDAHSHDDGCYTTFTDTVCGESEYAAHSHDDSCYTTFTDKICGESEYAAHSHDDGCYTEVSRLSCSDDSEEHSHDDGCYSTETKLSCSSKEGPGHSHSDSCYNEHTDLTCSAREGAGHSHSESCFRDRTELTCTAKEGPGHAHSESCYTDVTTQTCTAKEGPGHAHSEACYTEVTELTCSANEGPGHVHSETCEGIVCGKEETEGHVHDETCSELQNVLVCVADQEPEADDAGHTDDCYKKILACELEEHTHSSACYQPIEELAPICGLEEHVHTGYCYQMELICTVDHSAAAEDVHQHGEACYEQQSVLTCTLAEAEPHTHEEACYGVACGLEESEGHVHGDDCYTVTTEQTCGLEEGEAHTHDETCVTETKTLICETEESEGHTHDETCNGPICGLEETEGHTHGEECSELQDVLTCTIETEVPAGHTDECFEKTLICELEEHTHTEECYPVQMMMVLPEGAEIPEGYDDVRTFTSEDGTFGVAVYAPVGAIPEDAVLVAEILDEDSDEYAAAAESLDAMLAEQAAAEEETEKVIEDEAVEEVTEEEVVETEPAEGEPVDLGTETLILNDPAEGEPTEEPAEDEITEEPAEEPVVEETEEEIIEEEPAEEEAEKPYDGLIAMDIRFEDADGDEVEPYEPVYVVINALGLLPETADPASVSIQHHAEIQPVSTFSLRSLFTAPAEPEIVVTTVADATEDTGIVELAESRNEGVCDMLTAFPVESFSTFTITYSGSNLTGRFYTTAGTEFNVSGTPSFSISESWKEISEYISEQGWETLTDTDGNTYTFVEARANSADGTAFTYIRYNSSSRNTKFRYNTSASGNGDGLNSLYLIYEEVGAPLSVSLIDTSGNDIRTATLNIPQETVANIASAKPLSDLAPDVSGGTYQKALLGSKTGTEITKLIYTPGATADAGIWTYVTAAGDTGTWSGEGNPQVYLVYDTVLHIVPTVDSTSKGLYVYMFDYANPADSALGGSGTSGGYGDGTTKEGLLNRTLSGTGEWYQKFPTVTDMAQATTGTSMSTWFNPANGTAATHLFLKEVYDKTGWFYYNSFENFAELNDDGTFTVYKELGTPYEADDDLDQYFFQRGNFMPYNTLDPNNVLDHNLYDDLGYALPTTDPRYNEDLYGFVEDNNYYFGMYSYGQFYQPKDGLVNGDEMIFEFTGDDDLWVYIDGVLVLDLGGIHDAQSGSINFTTGEVRWTDTPTSSRLNPVWKTTTIKDQFIAANAQESVIWDNERTNTFVDGGLHTIQMFYMERGAGASNLKIQLNLPTIPNGSLMVRKDVENYYNAQMKDLEYTMKVTADGEDLANETYYIYPNEETTYTTDANGQFKLKHDQTAVFENVAGGTEIVVTEVAVQPEPAETGRIDLMYGINYSATDGNGQPVQSGSNASIKMPAAGSVSVVITNSALFTKPLTVTKTFSVDGVANAAMPENFDADFQLYQLGSDGVTWTAIGDPVPYSDFTSGSYTYMLEENQTYAVTETVNNAGVTASGVEYVNTSVTTVDEDTPTAAKPAGISGMVMLRQKASANPVGDTIAFENIYGVPNGDLSIDKTVMVNGTKNNSGTFTFKLEGIAAGYYETEVTNAQGVTSAGATLDIKGNGNDTVEIQAGTKLTIKGLPIGATVTVTETGYDGYAPSWNTSADSTVNHSPIAQAEVAVNTVTIHFTNTTGAALPNTGGVGTSIYTLLGSMMMLSAGVLLMIHRRRREAT